MIWRLLIISLVAVAVFSVSAIFYNYEIYVRDAEAKIMAREISDCLTGGGILNLDDILEEDYDNIVSYCGFDFSNRFYVGVNVLDSSGEEIVRFYEGDSGSLWVRELFSVTNKAIFGNEVNVNKYNPGYFKFEHSTFILSDGVRKEGKINVEVLVNHDE